MAEGVGPVSQGSQVLHVLRFATERPHLVPTEIHESFAEGRIGYRIHCYADRLAPIIDIGCQAEDASERPQVDGLAILFQRVAYGLGPIHWIDEAVLRNCQRSTRFH